MAQVADTRVLMDEGQVAWDDTDGGDGIPAIRIVLLDNIEIQV